MATIIEGIKFYTVKEVSETISVTAQSVRAWIRSGRLQAVRVGRPLLISERNLMDFLKEERRPKIKDF
jgi:excisionase family DNA binding protein